MCLDTPGCFDISEMNLLQNIPNNAIFPDDYYLIGEFRLLIRR